MGNETMIDWLFPSRLLWNNALEPVPGAVPVYWLVDGEWVRKGWLMPEAPHG